MRVDAVLDRGAGGQARRGGALLHGRGVARAEGPRSRQGVRDGRRRARDRAGDLRHARHADAIARRGGSKSAGLDYYNHNLDTSPEYYGAIISTRTYQDRLDTLEHVRDAGIHVCCGGIVGMGETREDRVGMIATLATLPAHPESVPINMLVQVEGTPLGAATRLDPSTSCARSPRRASPCRSRWCACRPAART